MFSRLATIAVCLSVLVFAFASGSLSPAASKPVQTVTAPTQP